MRLLPRMTLKSAEIENCSRIIRAILISSFRSSSCSQTSFPSIIRRIMYLWMMTSKIEFLFCRIQLLHLLLDVTSDRVEEDWWLSSRDRTRQDCVLMAQCQSIFFHILVWLLSSQRQFSYFLESILLVEKIDHLVEGCIRDKPLFAEIHQHLLSQNIVQLQQHFALCAVPPLFQVSPELSWFWTC